MFSDHRKFWTIVDFTPDIAHDYSQFWLVSHIWFCIVDDAAGDLQVLQI